MLRTEKGKADTTARHVLQVLAEHAHKDGTGARPSLLRIEYRSGHDERTIRRALRRLECGGLIEPDGVAASGCVSYRLHLSRRRPDSDLEELKAKRERERAATAERVRRHRTRVTDAESVTETASESVTGPEVTDAESVRNASSDRYEPDVTDAVSVCNGRNAPRTVNEPSVKEEPSSEPPAPDDSIPGQTCLIAAAEEAAAGKPRRARKKKASEKAAKPPRPDVDRICEHLADRIAANGSLRPTITQEWRDSARLLMDKDGRTEEQVHTAIDWCQDHDFWRSNIRSVPTLRKQYDQLRLQAMRDRGKQHTPYRNPADPAVYDEDFFAAVPAAPATDYDEDFFQ